MRRVFNGNVPSWTDLTITLEHDGASVDVSGFTSLDWSDKVDMTDVYAEGATKVGTSKGRYSAEGKLALLLTAASAFYASLAAVNPSITEVRFDVVAQWKANLDDRPTKVEMIECRLVDRNGSNSEGSEKAAVEHALNVTKILVDGVCLLEEEQS